MYHLRRSDVACSKPEASPTGGGLEGAPTAAVRPPLPPLPQLEAGRRCCER